MLQRVLSALGLRKAPPDRASSTTGKSDAVGSDGLAGEASYSHLEAARLLLGLIQAELVLHAHVPANLNVVSEEVFPLIPYVIRGSDTPVNRAEFAHVLHRGIIFLDAVAQAADARASTNPSP